MPKQSCETLNSPLHIPPMLFTGDKYPGAVLASIRPARGVSLEAAEASLMTELARLSSDGLTPAELQRIKKVGSKS